MTYGVARAATSEELELYRTPGKWSRYFAAIYQPRVIYTARVNQVFTSWDQLLSVVFDGGSGTLANVLPDMTMYVGTIAGGRDVGFVRIRGTDATHFFFDDYSGIKIMDNHFLTVVDEYRLLQRHITIDDDDILFDGTIAYSNQHSLPDPTPIMGPHRVLKMVDADTPIGTQFDFSQSYVIDGTSISSKVTTCPTALSVINGTTNTPTLNFDEPGWHTVYLVCTGANGKTFRGVRYVYVYNDDNLPPRVKIGNMAGNVDAGGWQADIEMYRNASVDDIYEGAFVIIFSEDHWGETAQDIFVVPGSRKIEMVGWIGSPESISQNPERGSVKFTVQGPQYWMQKVSAYPDGVRFKIGPATDWTEFTDLTIDKGVWHFLHWRTTATRILDFFPCGDTKLSPEVSSLAENLWAQLQEMTALQILARPGFNAIGQLFIQVNPNLIPAGDRDYETVMSIEKSDWIGQIDFDRIPPHIQEVAQSHLSGIVMDNGGDALAYFAVAPGHTYEHYGTPEVIDKLLISSQAQVVSLAGLYHAWRNSEFPSIPINLKFNIRLIDIFPNQRCEVSIQPGDTVRGIFYAGGVIPVSINVQFNDETGQATREIEFEKETVEGLAVTEQIPGTDDVSRIPDPDFPEIPDFPIELPGGYPPTTTGPQSIIIHDIGTLNRGLMMTNNFNDASPEWFQCNGGLTVTQYESINLIRVCRLSGACYVANTEPGADTFLAYAPNAGASFTIVEDFDSITDKYGSSDNISVRTINYNPFTGRFVYALSQAGENVKLFEGTGTDFTEAANITINTNNGADLSFGLNKWMFTASGKAYILPANASAVERDEDVGVNTCSRHVRGTTSGRTIHFIDAGNTLAIGENNCTTVIGEVGNNYDALYIYNDAMACDPTGQFLMTRDNLGPTPIKSSDGGASHSVITGLAPLVQHKFLYVTAAEWIAVAGQPMYSDDFGITWESRQGNLLTLCPLLECNAVQLVAI